MPFSELRGGPGRALEGLKASTVSIGAMRELVRNIEEMKKLQMLSLPDERYRAEMADESKPLSDEAIAEWNKRRK